jgi:diguanylate cyclase (GGDEF)-like protein/PAS domain S-box-containing protein
MGSNGIPHDKTSSRDDPWKGWHNGRLFAGTYFVRSLLLLSLALASVAVRATWAALGVVAVVLPFNLVVARWHRRRGEAHPWLCFDLVLAAATACIAPQVLVGSAISILANSGVGTLASGRRRVQNFALVACAIVLLDGVIRHDAVFMAFSVPLLLCSLAISRVVDYVDAKQLANSARFEDLLDGIHAAVIEVDARTGVVLYCNQHAEDLIGLSPTESCDLLNVIHEEDRVRVEGQILDAIAVGVATAVDLRALIGSEVHFLEMRATLSTKGDKTRLRMVLLDVSARRNIELELAHRASHDALTDLPNRTHFRETVDAATHHSSGSSSEHAVLMLDLDSFKDINDALGHHHGDLLLVEVARRLQRAIRPNDLVARLGGDEFAVLLAGCDEHGAMEIAKRIRATVAEPYDAEGVTIVPEVSVGIACFPGDGQSAADLLRLSDVAMYRAKRSRIGWAMYSVEVDAGAHDRFIQQAALRTTSA